MIELTKERALEILGGIRELFENIMSVDVPKEAISILHISNVLEEVRLKYGRHIRRGGYYIQIYDWVGDALNVFAIGLPGTNCSPDEREYEALRHGVWNLYYNVLEVIRKK